MVISVVNDIPSGLFVCDTMYYCWKNTGNQKKNDLPDYCQLSVQVWFRFYNHCKKWVSNKKSICHGDGVCFGMILKDQRISKRTNSPVKNCFGNITSYIKYAKANIQANKKRAPLLEPFF